MACITTKVLAPLLPAEILCRIADYVYSESIEVNKNTEEVDLTTASPLWWALHLSYFRQLVEPMMYSNAVTTVTLGVDLCNQLPPTIIEHFLVRAIRVKINFTTEKAKAGSSLELARFWLQNHAVGRRASTRDSHWIFDTAAVNNHTRFCVLPPLLRAQHLTTTIGAVARRLAARQPTKANIDLYNLAEMTCFCGHTKMSFHKLDTGVVLPPLTKAMTPKDVRRPSLFNVGLDGCNDNGPVGFW